MIDIPMRLIIQEGEPGHSDAVAIEVLTETQTFRNAWKFRDAESKAEAIQFAFRWAGERLTQ
jgi:hypothetical protein